MTSVSAAEHGMSPSRPPDSSLLQNTVALLLLNPGNQLDLNTSTYGVDYINITSGHFLPPFNHTPITTVRSSL